MASAAAEVEDERGVPVELVTVGDCDTSDSIQVLVRAGLIKQERSGRISRCSLDASPLLGASVWINRYSKYWQQQFDLLAATLADIDERRPRGPHTKRASRKAARHK